MDDRAGSMDAGAVLHRFATELYPICRSITGDGLRETLRIIAREIPLQIREIPTDTGVLDWTVPKEWNVRGARLSRINGETVADFADHNLRLLQYSVAIDRVVPVAELRRHLHTIPDHPDWIPYRTAYYAETWGFCLTQSEADALTDPEYRVRIDTRLEPGSMTFGELALPGESEDEVLLSCHCCHPSLANDNLSGIAIATLLAQHLTSMRRRLTYRFLFIPATIGSIAWLALNEDGAFRIKHGLVLTCLGDPGDMTYKQSRRGDARIDRIAAHVLRHAGPHTILPFTPYGYDERQYGSPGFDLPVGCLMRSPNGTYPEYHSSADNLDFVRPEFLADSFANLRRIVDVLEQDGLYLSTNPKGEPQLGRRGLYRAIAGQKEAGGVDQMALLWVLNLADGRHSLLDMAERAGMPFEQIRRAADLLLDADLLTPVSFSTSAESSVS